ncbi:MAG: HEPN domain-containing protein [Candidatus Korarchaeota archaeon]|nr:HEPN domain-containing protein [Candidatus Korarchaeota archaeon]NIU84206.1 HEPN domain-containing protein [Candidatus Thorarchaeota archaeon]NIW14358.1 HEPN domain-containing protein [Candidatus Thorarchaeota archaeon]NIW52444.1 HEPN domain-containing protein [Candidatus Korarchaeota archaeon]
MREITSEWVKRAEEDYEAMRRLLISKTPNAVAFHAQQCAEKYLKAFLIEHKRKPLKTHNLAKLNALCKDIDPRFQEIDGKLKYLLPYAVHTRYPTESATKQEAKDAKKKAEKVRKFVEKKFVDQ